MAREQSNFPGLKDPRKQSALGRMADRDVLRAQKAAAWQALTAPQPQPEMTKIPSAKEFALNSRVAEANREEKPTGALALILRELPRFFKADDELADAMGDFSLRQGATATGGAILGLAAPAYLPLRTALTRAATGVPLSVAGGWAMDPAAEKIFGSSVSDPLSDAVFGAMAGASGKIVTPMLSAIATSSGDAEAAPGKVLRYVASKSDGNLTRPFKVHKTPFAAEAEFNLPGATRIRRTPEPLTESEGKAYEGMSVVPLLMDSGAERSVLRGDAINRITGERFAKGGLARIAARMGSDAAPARRGVSNVIKEKGGNWLTGSVEDALGGLKRPLGQAHDRAMFTEEMLADPRIAREAALRDRESVLNSFIDKQLTRYVKNEMATPGDPIRALAERGVLHYAPGEAYVGNLPKTRVKSATSPLAGGWEDQADTFVNVGKPRDFISNANFPASQSWLGKVPAEQDVYWTSGQHQGGGDLGFSHLTDELANALNPESGLPRHLLLDPKSMDRVSVPQAVERVAEINKWRAAQKAEADALRANNAATVLHKEYPDKGFKWVELRQPEETGRLVQGAARVDPRFEVPQEVQDRLQDQAYREALRRGIADDSDDMMEFVEGRTQELARQWDAKNPARIDEARKALQDALKYEGDTMGHCVGGYCDDVASGRAKIYSLRDAKGQPHVTIEVRPDDNWKNTLYEASLRGNAIDEMFGERAPEIIAAFKSSPFRNIEQFLARNPQYLPESNRIVQIKGKQNKAPNKEYLPFVQDFVRSGKWSYVGDLWNTGLRRPREIWNALELQQIREAGHTLGEYVSPEEKKAIVDAGWPGQWGRYAKGGLVQHPSGYLTRDELGKLVDEGDLDAIRLWQQSYIDR